MIYFVSFSLALAVLAPQRGRAFIANTCLRTTTLFSLTVFPQQVASSSARRASSCSTPPPSSSGCSAASLCCFMGLSPLSSPACPGTPWPSWPGEERWGLAEENTRWTLCRCPVRTHSHILTLTHLRTCLYCSLSATVASHTPVFALRTLMATVVHYQSGGCCRMDSTRLLAALLADGSVFICLRRCVFLALPK